MPEEYKVGGSARGTIGQREDSFEAIPEILASRASGDQARDAQVSQIPQMTCLVEFLEERKTAILGEEVHEIPGDGVQAVKDAPRDVTVPGSRAPLDVGPAQSSACKAAAYADQPQSQCCPPR